jgi:hypothetical protein
MLGLLRQTVRPTLGLQDCVEHWHDISFMLREPPRKRRLQMEKMFEEAHLLS